MKQFILWFLIMPFLMTGPFLFSQDTVVIGIDNNYPPYEYVDERGTAVGFNIDITTRILKDNGYEYRIEAHPWDITYQLFKEGKVDVISMLFSEERNAMYYLSIPHNQVTYGVFYNKENHDLIESFDYKEGIIVVKDDVMHELLRSKKLDDNVIAVENSEKALKLLNKDDTRIALLPKVQSMYLINKNKLENIELSERYFYKQKYCFAVDKSRQDLIFALNEGLSLLKEKKVYDRLLQKWFSPLEQTKIPFSKVIDDYLLILLLIGLVFFIVVLWNLTLKRAINRRNKELRDELQARERSEMAIIESEERFRTLTENSPAAIVIFNQNKIFFTNNAATQLTLFSKEEMQNMSFFEFLQDDKEKQFVSDFFLQARKNKVSSFKKDILMKNRKGQQLWANVSAVKSYYKAEPVIIATAFDVTDRHFYEQEIIESRRMFSTLLDNLPGMVYQCENDKDWTMFFISDGCMPLTEYTADELLFNKNRSYNDIIHVEDRSYVWNTIQAAIAKKSPFTLEYRIVTKSGLLKWVWEQGRLIQKKQNTFLEGYITDITDRVNTRHTLIKERIKYETMLQSIGDGVISTDNNGRITLMNNAAEKLTGWKLHDALGKPLEDVFIIINENTRETCENPYKKVLETGAIVGLANHTVLISKEGSEYIISDSAAPIKNEEGEVTGVIIVFSDNTANRRAEDAIVESEAKLKATLQAIPDLIFKNNADGYFTDFYLGSDQELMLEPDKIIGAHISDIFSEKFSHNIINTFKRCLKSGESQKIEYYFDTPKGRFYYEAKVVKYSHDEVLALCRDITERKKIEEEISNNYKFQKIIADISLLLNSSAHVEAAITETLEIIGQYLKANRVYIFENFGDNDLCKNTYEWCDNNTKSLINELQEVNYKLFTGFRDNLIDDGIFILTKNDNYSDNLFFKFISSDAGSLVCLPLYNRGEFSGFLGLDCTKERVFTMPETELLRTLSVLISNSFERITSKKLLQAEREQLETTLYSIGDAVIVTDVKGHIVHFNKIAESITSFSKDEAYQKDVQDLLKFCDASTRKHLPSFVEQVLVTGEVYTYENVVYLNIKNNNEFIISGNASPVFDKEKGIIGVIIVFRDKTEKTKADNAIRQSEENYRKLFDTANDVIFILEGNNIVNCNQKTEKIFGFSKKEIIGKTPSHISPPYQSDGVTSEEKAAYYIDLAYKGEPIHFEWDHLNAMGQIINCEISLNRLEIGNKSMLQAIVRDITQRKEYEKALSESEEKYKTLVEKANDGITIVQNNKLVFANRKLTEISGFNLDELIGKPFIDFIHPDYQDLILKYNAARQAKETNIPSIYDIKAIHKSGHIISLELNSNYINYTGQPAALVVVRDITQRKLSEEKLNIFKATIENSTDAIGMATAEGVHYYQNAAFDRLFGNLAGVDIATVYKYEKDKIEVFDTIMNGKQYISEIEMYSKDGELLNVLLRAYPVFDDAGNITSLVSIHTDITQTKQAEKALLQSEEKYRLLFENISQGFALHEIITDDFGKPVDYRYITVNPAFGNLTGMNIENISGKTIKELLPNIENFWIESFGEVALTGNPIHYENYSEELEKYYDTWVFSPKKGQFAVIFSDITERKASENAINALLTLSQMGDKSLQEISDYALNECVNLTYSQIAFLAFTSENLSQITLNSFSKDVFVNDASKNQSLTLELSDNSLFTKAIRTKKAVLVNNYNEHLLKKDLPLWHLKIERVLIVPIEENNKTVALATVANKKGNYTERDVHQITLIIDRLWKTVQSKRYNESIQKLNAELIEKNKEMEQFVYVTSHDLRSPLVNIQGFTKVLADNCRSIKDSLNEEITFTDFKNKISSLFKEDIDESLKFIELSTRKMDALLNGLLKLSRMGRIIPNVKSVDMNLLVKDVVNSFEFQIIKKNIQVEVVDLHDCLADEALISQVFSNLIDNAIKYNDKKNPVIKISSQKNKNKITYCIEDNGPGIPEKYYNKVFEIFQRLNASVSGEGLGLSIVNKIIEKHNGRIWIESVVNKGAKFFIEI